jgi:hypothetical protein
MNDKQTLVWKILFLGIVVGYCLFYAPYGVNETDGGFLTGLAWQVLQGKMLYQDMVYVRPPLPVWLRALEIKLLPEHFAVLGERWIFYGKIALYSALSAVILVADARRWQLATLGFVVSAHCYPAMAWHTVDGILFAVLALFFTFKKSITYLVFAGICLFCSLLCKQSFYPLLPLFVLFLFFEPEQRWKRMIVLVGACLLCFVLFYLYLDQNKILTGFIQMTSGAASGGQALQHGILDYFRITPELALPSLLLLSPVAWWFWKGKNRRLAQVAWSLWLFALVATYVLVTWLRQEHTVPFAQSRIMFWVAGMWCLRPLFFLGASKFRGFQMNSQIPTDPSAGFLPLKIARANRLHLVLLGISWCAAVSWGYNLPILFATPWVWAGMEVTRMLEQGSRPFRFLKYSGFMMLFATLFAFRIGYEFVYRDGRRSDMTEAMGEIFPRLSGIYSDRETAELYQDLKALSGRYGPNFTILPAFPQANFLTNTKAPLPLDWVVNRETNNNNALVFMDLKEKNPIIFIQKAFQEKLKTDPELEVTRWLLDHGQIIEETPHFWVLTNYKQ